MHSTRGLQHRALRRCDLQARGVETGEGTFTLSHDGVAVGTVRFAGGLPFVLQHGGTALRLGSDRGFPVSDAYTPPFPWNGTLHRVVFETPGVRPADVADVRAALHAD